MSDHGYAGWPEAPGAPALPVTEMLLANKRYEPGDNLAMALARSRDEPDEQPDPDERAANLVARGVRPGMVSELSAKLADCETELAAEQEKLEKAARRQERIRRDHDRGLITAWDIARMQDFDEGDAARAARLERKAERLRAQLAEAAALISPAAQWRPDPVEDALGRAREAHREFVESTRAKMAGRQPRASRPFGYASRGGTADKVTCPDCVAVGASPAESFLLHTDPAPMQPADWDQELAEYSRETGVPYWPETGRAAHRVQGYYELQRGTEGAILGVR
jgi:hypothetical protein